MAKVYFVNEEKRERAAHLFNLLTGKEVARNSEEVERIAHYARIAAADGLDLKKEEEAVVALYLKLGGLLRSEAEHKEAEQKKAAAKVRGKRDKMGLR